MNLKKYRLLFVILCTALLLTTKTHRQPVKRVFFINDTEKDVSIFLGSKKVSIASSDRNPKYVYVKNGFERKCTIKTADIKEHSFTVLNKRAYCICTYQSQYRGKIRHHLQIEKIQGSSEYYRTEIHKKAEKLELI